MIFDVLYPGPWHPWWLEYATALSNLACMAYFVERLRSRWPVT